MNQKNNNKYCTECGAKLEHGSKYCQECGEKIDNDTIIKKIGKGLIIGGAFLLLAFVVLMVIVGLTGAGNYPNQAYQDNIDGVTVYIPAGYKHIETKYISVKTSAGMQILKTAIYKNKKGKEITISKMSEGEMYIMGHGKKVPTGNIINTPDGAYGTLKQRGNFYLLVSAEDTNILQTI